MYAVNGDGVDYYSYLVSVFINHNPGHQDPSAWFIINTPTGTINVHTLGVSLLLSPFFFIGYLWALITGAELTGLSAPFQKMVCIGALTYVMLGLYFLKRLLLDLHFSDKITALTLTLVFFGTNLLNYAINEPSMAHVYSFALIAIFLFYINRLTQKFSSRYLYLAAASLALIILVRPVNVIVILAIPFFAGSFDAFRVFLKDLLRHKRQLVISIVAFFSIVMLQPLMWYFQNQHFIQWSYKGNGFYFSDPHTLLMLFGFDSGFFIYTPLCFILLGGLIPLFSKNKFQFAVLFLFLSFCFYLFSCYWGYTYFDGLGIRTFVDFYAIFSILLATLLTYVSSKRIKWLVFPITGFAAFLNLIFCYQYNAGILPAAGMNSNKFSYIFLHTGGEYAGVLGGCMDMAPYSETAPQLIFSYQGKENYTYTNNEFGLGWKADSLKIASNKLFVKVKLRRKEESINSSYGAMLVVHIESKEGQNRSYQAYKLNDTPSETCCEWQEFSYQVTIADKLEPSDKLSVYVWNKEKQRFSIDNFNIEVYNYNFKTS
jgi:hypothetical protein